MRTTPPPPSSPPVPPLRIRFSRTLYRGVELTCPVCGLVLNQPARDPVAAQCPKCGAVWR